jgi:hypothetical protein
MEHDGPDVVGKERPTGNLTILWVSARVLTLVFLSRIDKNSLEGTLKGFTVHHFFYVDTACSFCRSVLVTEELISAFFRQKSIS